MKKFLHYIVLLVMSVLGCGSDNIEGSAEVRCEKRDDGTHVFLHGTLEGGNALIDYPSNPSGISFGANPCYGWDADVKWADWLGEGNEHELVLPTCVTEFNFRVMDESGASDVGWGCLHDYDSSPWAVEGDCTVGDGLILVN